MIIPEKILHFYNRKTNQNVDQFSEDININVKKWIISNINAAIHHMGEKEIFDYLAPDSSLEEYKVLKKSIQSQISRLKQNIANMNAIYISATKENNSLEGLSNLLKEILEDISNENFEKISGYSARLEAYTLEYNRNCKLDHDSIKSVHAIIKKITSLENLVKLNEIYAIEENETNKFYKNKEEIESDEIFNLEHQNSSESKLDDDIPERINCFQLASEKKQHDAYSFFKNFNPPESASHTDDESVITSVKGNDNDGNEEFISMLNRQNNFYDTANNATLPIKQPEDFKKGVALFEVGLILTVILPFAVFGIPMMIEGCAQMRGTSLVEKTAAKFFDKVGTLFGSPAPLRDSLNLPIECK